VSRAEPAARSVLICLDGRSPAVELPDGDSVRFGWQAGEITVGTLPCQRRKIVSGP